MEQINISELRANLLTYLKKAKSGHPITVTSNGEVLATIAEPDALRHSAKKALSELATTAQIGDIVENTGESWSAMQ